MSDLITTLRNRIVEVKEVDASEIMHHPNNWRVHTQSQTGAVEDILQQVGIVQTLIAYYSEREGGKLVLIDGHLRHGLGGRWPVTITDLTDEEADLILSLLHPLGDMAEMDSKQLGILLGRLELQAVQGDDLNALVESLQQDIDRQNRVATPVVYAEGQRGSTPAEDLDDYLNATIRQITLAYDGTEYLWVISVLRLIQERHMVDTNTDAVTWLLKEYEVHYANHTDAVTA